MAERASRKQTTPPIEDAIPNILLIGLRGSGKSTIGAALAESIEHQFIDLDVVTLWRLRCATVEEAWREQGVPRFRAAEAEGLRSALDNPERVIAAGGGTPTAPGAAEAIRTHQERNDLFVVYFRGAPAALRSRLESLAADPNRPSITGDGMLDEIDEVYHDRDPLYCELADEIIDLSADAAQIVQEIQARVRDMQNSKS